VPQFVADGVNPLAGQVTPDLLRLPGLEEIIDLFDPGGKVLDADDPLRDILADDMTTEADLDAPIRQTRTTQGAFRVPL
jgi:hypothetical protein